MVLTGRCLCGQVRYEIEGELPPLVNCHCRFCRRAHGTAFVTIAWIPHSALRVTQGEDRLSRYAVGDRYRAFCSRCGSRLFNASEDGGGFLSLVVSSLDDASHLGPVLHLNVESKAPWHVIGDSLPQFESFSPGVLEELRRNARR